MPARGSHRLAVAIYDHAPNRRKYSLNIEPMHQLRGARPLQPSNSAPASPANATRRRRPARSCRAYAAALWLHASDHISRHAGLDRRVHRHRIIIFGEHHTGALAKLRIHANLLNHLALCRQHRFDSGRVMLSVVQKQDSQIDDPFSSPGSTTRPRSGPIAAPGQSTCKPPLQRANHREMAAALSANPYSTWAYRLIC